MRSALGLALVFLVCSCPDDALAAADRRNQDPLRQADEDTIRELVFRHYMRGCEARQIFFLTFDGMKEPDPPLSFLARFGDLGPSCVRIGTRMTVRADDFFVDAETGEKGVSLRIENLRWISDTQVEVDAGWGQARDCGAGDRFRLTKYEGEWFMQTVVGDHWEA